MKPISVAPRVQAPSVRALATLVLAFSSVVLALPAPAAAQAGAGDGTSAESLYIDQLGCSGCHGREGEGGVGPGLRDSELSVAKFLKQVRLPSDIMPPISPILASDTDLALIYQWLDGTETVAVPPPVVLEPEGFEGASPGGEAEVAFAARRDEGSGAEGVDGPVRFRITLLARDNTPAAGKSVAYRLPGGDGWAETTTDPEGRALLGPEEGVPANAALGRDEAATTRLRLAVPEGEHAVVVEALDWSDPAAPVTLGVGTALLRP